MPKRPPSRATQRRRIERRVLAKVTDVLPQLLAVSRARLLDRPTRCALAELQILVSAYADIAEEAPPAP
jgi:hypothetical protein